MEVAAWARVVEIAVEMAVVVMVLGVEAVEAAGEAVVGRRRGWWWRGWRRGWEWR